MPAIDHLEHHPNRFTLVLGLIVLSLTCSSMSAAVADGEFAERASSLKLQARKSYHEWDVEKGREHLVALHDLYRTEHATNPGWRGDYQYSYRLSEVAHEYLRAGQLRDALSLLGEVTDLDVPLRGGFDNGLSSVAGALYRQLEQLDADGRYALLQEWTMPTGTRQSIRVLEAFVPVEAPPSEFARALRERPRDSSFPVACVGEVSALFSTAWELVQSAAQAGRLRSLLTELEQAANDGIAGAEYVLTLALIVNSERLDEDLETRLLQRLATLRDGQSSSDRKTSRFASAWQYGYGSFDELNQRTKEFTPFPHWSGAAWQLNAKRPHPTFGFVRLDRTGGHPGPSAAAVRRWIAPADGVLSVTGTLHHPLESEDGVRGRVISSSSGLRGEWVVHDGTVKTNLAAIPVQAGDTIDFAVDKIESTAGDSFIWLIQLELTTASSELYFDSVTDFCGPFDHEIVSETVIAAACLERDWLLPIGEGILEALLKNTYDTDPWMNRPDASDSPLLRPVLRRAWATALRKRYRSESTRLFDDPGLKFWVPSSAHTASQHAAGHAQRTWLVHENHILHLAGPGDDCLWLKYPLTGEFSLSIETLAGGRPGTDGGIVYGGLGCSLDGCDQVMRIADTATRHEIVRPSLTLRTGARTGGRYVGQPAFNRLTVSVNTDRVSFLANGQPIWSDESDDRTSPWFALSAFGDRMPIFRKLELTGHPVVPREVSLLRGDSLRGWTARYYGDRIPPPLRNESDEFSETANGNHQVPDVILPLMQGWHVPASMRLGGAPIGPDRSAVEYDWVAQDGILYGSRREPRDATVAQSRMHYLRPMFSGESITYEFFYESGQYEVHPALGRLAFLIEPDGVHLHWMTDGDREWTGLAADNEIVVPLDRRGPRPLPLVEENWNRIKLALNEDKVILMLNEQQIYQRTLTSRDERTFGFYHDACHAAVQVKNVVMSGRWPERLDGEQRELLAAVTDMQRSEPDQLVLNNLFQDKYLTEDVLRVARHAATLPDAQRFDYLAEWVLPGRDHSTLRMVGLFTSLPAPPRSDDAPIGVPSPIAPARGGSNRLQVGAQLVSPALQLVDVAKRLDRLDDIRNRLPSSDHARGGQGASQLATMLTLIELAAGDFVSADEQLGVLFELNRVSTKPQLVDLWPEMLAVWTAWRFAQTRKTASELVEVLNERVRSGRLGESEAWMHHLASFSAVGRLQNEWKASGPTEVLEPLQQWAAVTHVTARSRGQGFPAGRWSRRPYRVDNVVAHDRDYLYFQSPLRGNFQVECDVSSEFDRRESSLVYDGWWTRVDPGLADYHVGDYHTREMTGETARIAPPLTNPGPWMRYRLAVQDGRIKVYCNGRCLHEREIAERGDPWLALRTSWERNGGVGDVRIWGEPVIPEQVDLPLSAGLPGWLPYFDEPVGIGSTGWYCEADELVGRKQIDSSAADHERLLHYHRPMLEDGTIEYEFYYEPNKIHIHPALDRLVLLLDSNGVQEHWAASSEIDEPANIDDQRRHRRGLAPLPLQSGTWNRLRLTLSGDTVSLVLNDQLVYERPLEPTNLRTFGLFYNAAATMARVKNITWRGDWPRELPPVTAQELADVSDVTAVDRQIATLPTVVDHDFSTGLGDNFAVADGDKQCNPTLTAGGLKIVHTAADGNGNSTIGNLFSIGGDFDIRIPFERLATQTDATDDNSHAGISAQVTMNNSEYHTCYMVRKQHPGIRRQLEMGHSWGVGDEHRHVSGDARIHDGKGGTFRFARLGETLFLMFADGNSSQFRIVARYTVPREDVAINGIRLTTHARGRSSMQVVWKNITIRSEQFTEPDNDLLAGTLRPGKNIAPVRYVRVDLPDKQAILSLAEVEVFSKGKNVALNKDTSQSSVDYKGEAVLAVDGDRNGHYFVGRSTTHTRLEREPWWEVDLGKPYVIDHVLIWNRSDFGSDRLNGFRVQLLDENRKVLFEQQP